MSSLDLWIPTRPMPAPRPRGKQGQKAYYPKAYQEWLETVGWQVQVERAGRQVEGPVALNVGLYADGFRARLVEMDVKGRHGLRGDWDNYGKAISDGLEQGGVYENDNQIVQATVSMWEAK